MAIGQLTLSCSASRYSVHLIPARVFRLFQRWYGGTVTWYRVRPNLRPPDWQYNCPLGTITNWRRFLSWMIFLPSDFPTLSSSSSLFPFYPASLTLASCTSCLLESGHSLTPLSLCASPDLKHLHFTRQRGLTYLNHLIQQTQHSPVLNRVISYTTGQHLGKEFNIFDQVTSRSHLTTHPSCESPVSRSSSTLCPSWPLRLARARELLT